MAKIVSIDGLQAAVAGIMNDYADHAAKISEECVKKVAKASVDALKGMSPQKTGGYASGWMQKTEVGRLQTKATVYNNKKPGLPHLLEHGHVTRNGTSRTMPRTPAHEHIAPIEAQIIDRIISEIEVKL